MKKPKLDNARKFRGIYFIDPEDKGFKETFKNARKKLETPVAPAMPCKMSKNNQNWVTHGKSNEFKSKFACILEASESTRMRMGNSKISAWNLTKVRSKKEVIDEARTIGAKVHFASLMDICRLKIAELEAKHQKYKGRVVLRGDIVKDNSRSYAVFTEQGSSASQMTAAKIMDIISRLPGCDGHAAEAVSAYTQVKMEDAHKLLKNSKVGVSRHSDSSTTTQLAKTMVQYGRPSFSS